MIPAKVLIVDDEPDIRGLVRLMLERHGYQAAEAENGSAALAYTQSHTDLDLILLDIMMPGMDGVETCRALRQFCNAPVLFLTARTQEQDKAQAYGSGGDDYLGKPFSQAELLMKVDSLIRRYHVYRGKTDRDLIGDKLELRRQQRQVLKDGKRIELTDIEYEILQFLIDHRGAAVSAQMIYEAVWNEKYMPSSTNTVMVHVLNLRKKVEDIPSDPQIIRTVWGRGYQID